ncbi:hypothetical protein BHE74_00039316 [Ensete ventricosum]|nr:hypothetical protein BHE74_00039316 [Ensete ventricosum]RZS07623.1 hypothetical protein BHM03_00038489 [Ensete ventricosum]
MRVQRLPEEEEEEEALTPVDKQSTPFWWTISCMRAAVGCHDVGLAGSPWFLSTLPRAVNTWFLSLVSRSSFEHLLPSAVKVSRGVNRDGKVFLFFFFFSQLFQDSTSDVGLQLWLHVRCSSLTSLISWGRNANAAEKEAAFALATLMEVPRPTQSDGGARHSRVRPLDPRLLLCHTASLIPVHVAQKT